MHSVWETIASVAVLRRKISISFVHKEKNEDTDKPER